MIRRKRQMYKRASLPDAGLGLSLHRHAAVETARGFHPGSYTHLRAHETKANLVCRLLLEPTTILLFTISLVTLRSLVS